MMERCGRCGKPEACGAAGLCYACNELADEQERDEQAEAEREYKRQMREWRNDSGA